jgi:hypothetical protein
MASSCGAQYILRDCTCLADPLNFYSNVCGYVSKQNGLVYPCDAGCCLGKCENKDPVTRVEVRPSAGIDLPPGYGANIPQTEMASNIPGATDISTPTTLLPGGIRPISAPAHQYKVWQILLIALVPLLLVIVASCFLA